MVLFFSGGDRYKALYFKPGVYSREFWIGVDRKGSWTLTLFPGGEGVLRYVGHICAAVKGMVFKQFTLA